MAKNALKMFKWALKIDPKIAYFWGLKAQALEILHMREEAQEAHKQSEAILAKKHK